MRIVVWGLGYVGTVSAACFANLGHDVIGIETNSKKVEALNAGTSAVIEPGLAELVRAGVAAGRLRAFQNGVSCVAESDISLICVGTPSLVDGSADLMYLRNVARDIGCGLRDSTHYHVVVIRSTVHPRVVQDILIPELETHSQRTAGVDFGVAINPEFLRETSAIKDFFDPPYTVIGEFDARSGDAVASLYADIQARLYRVSLDEAALVKVVNNAFHALKVGFANEIGRICDAVQIDSRAVMKLVTEDTKLNISPAYLQPGFAFGGSCLPKDLRSLIFNANQLDVPIPILEAILPSNTHQINLVRLKIHQTKAQRIAILGLSFKPGTDDLRESPVLQLIRDLWRDGLDITVYDSNVQLDRMLGSNRMYLDRELPQIERIIRPSIEATLAGCEAVIVSQKLPEFDLALSALNPDVFVIDLVHLDQAVVQTIHANYTGISW